MGDIAMELPGRDEPITVFHDGDCGVSCTFREWVNRQEWTARIRFVCYRSPEAERTLPGVRRLAAERGEMVVWDEVTGALYRRGEAWVCCLASLAAFRPWAERLATPLLLPFAEKTCRHLALNRRKLAQVFFRRQDAEVAAELARMPPRPAACLAAPAAIPDPPDSP